MIDFVLRHGNDLLAVDSLKGFEGSLKEQGRILRQGELLVVEKHHKAKRRVFLFEHTIILAKTKRRKNQPEIAGSEVFEFRSSYKVWIMSFPAIVCILAINDVQCIYLLVHMSNHTCTSFPPQQTSDFTLYENVNAHPTRFELRKRKESLVFQAETEEEKAFWSQDIWDLYFSHMLKLKGEAHKIMKH